MKNTPEVRKKAIRYLSNKNGYSYKIASYIIDCMSISKRKLLFDKFRSEKDLI